MYIEDNNYWNNIHGSDRTVRARFIIDGTTYSESMVTSAEFETSVEGDNGVSIAGCFAKKMTAVIDNVSAQNWNNVTIESHIDITLNGTTYDIPMGIYIPDTVEPNEDGRTVTITAYDQVANMVEEIEVQDDGMDTTSLEFLQDCLRSRGIIGSYIPYETPFVLPPGRYPLRTWVAYITGYYGKSAYLLRKPSGVGEWFVEVEMKPGDKTGTIYNTPKYMIDRDAVYQGGFKRTKTNLVVDAIQSENDSYGDLSGNVLSITDPLITPGTISSWGNNIVGVDDIYSYEIHYRGNPVYEVGQTVRVRDKDGNYYPVTITKHVIKVQGGMEGYIYSTFPSSSENLTNQTSPTNELIARKLSDYALRENLSPVAFSGSYNDLTTKLDFIGGRNYLLESYGRPTGSNSGVTRTYLGNCTYKLTGTSTADGDPTFYALGAYPLENGGYTLSIDGDVSKFRYVYVSICDKNDTSVTTRVLYNTTDGNLNKINFELTGNETIRYIGYRFASGVTFGNEYQFKLEKGNIVTDWTPAPRDLLTVTTESITGINVAGGTITSALTFDISKEGYYPLGIVGQYWSTGTNVMYGNVFYKYLSAQDDGSGTITYRIRNMLSSQAITGTLVFKVLWIKI